MKRLYVWSLAAVLWGGQAIAAESSQEKSKGEIRVYVADKDKKPVDLKDVTGTVFLEPEGGAKRTLKLQAETPKGSQKNGIGHGGDVQEAGAYHVEFVVEKGHGDHKDEHKSDDGTPFLSAEIDLTGYTCGMSGHPVVDKAGKCPKCPMTAKPVDLKFSAVVVLKIGQETVNAKGFVYPAAGAKDYSGALAKIEEHLKAIDALIAASDLDKVHSSAEKISHVAETLPALAPKDDKAEVEKIAKEIIALFKEIDDAADAGKKAETIKVVAKYRAKVAELKKHAK
jgi:hypothetical protein